MKIWNTIRRIRRLAGLSLVLFCATRFCATARVAPPDSGYQDLTHPSKVFGHEKYYRLYLPEGYNRSTDRYPVIYFFHGWGGRHFMDDNAKLEYVKLKSLVDAYQVILVMWDGNIEETEPRPYNVGNNEDVKYQVQMADYFPELIAHIDSRYRTFTDRNHRGIIGFSMGGFMSLFLAGKYPDRIGAVVSMAGSPEFFVGSPGVHTLYPIRYTFKNLQGVHLRMHNGDSDILYFLNQEAHQGALWEGIPLEYWEFHGPHMVDYPGETRVFDSAMKFVVEAFRKKTPVPDRWTHIDLYPDFDAWGYHIASDKHEPGFIVLRNVDTRGFGISTRRWLPAGPPFQKLRGTVTTPPLYAPRSPYNIAEYRHDTLSQKTIVSDPEGRLSLDFDAAGGEIGISGKADFPEYIFLDYRIAEHGRFLKAAGSTPLHVRLFNRGGENTLPCLLRVKIRSTDSTVVVTDSLVTVQALPGHRIVVLPPVNVSCAKTPPGHAEPPDVHFVVSVATEKGMFTDEMIVPVQFEVPFFDSVKIDDGIAARGSAFGKGNADGTANAGESIMVYQGGHRLRLYTDDPWIVRADERLTDEMIPARWPDGFTLSSIVHIAPDCPEGHQIECLASYEAKSFNPIERTVTWGRVRIIVRGN